MRGKGFVVALLACASEATAAPTDAEIDFSIGYGAPSGCPSSADFEGAVVARATRAHAVSREQATLVFDATIAESSTGFSGELWVRLPDGTRFRRNVLGSSCSEAAMALALIAALSLDGYRESTRKEQAASVQEPKPLPSPVAAPLEAAPEGRSPAARDDTSKPSRTIGTPKPGVFAAGAWESAVAPLAPLGVLAGFELAFGRSGALRPNLRLGFLYTMTSTETTESGSADFRMMTGRLSGCPFAWGDALAVHACVELDAGTLDAVGTGAELSNPRPRGMAWLGVGPAARGAWNLEKWFSVEATFGVRGLLYQDRFVFNPAAVVHDVPPVSVGLGLGLAARMP